MTDPQALEKVVFAPSLEKDEDDPLQLWHAFVKGRGGMEDGNAEPNDRSNNTHNHTNISKKFTTDELFRLGDLLFGATLWEAALVLLDQQAVRRVVAPSQRTAYLVTSASRRHSGPTAQYLCLVPPHTNQQGVYYCTCRSFYEKNHHQQHKNVPPTRIQLCKHLLAIEIAEPLTAAETKWSNLFHTVTTSTDEEFGRLLVTQGFLATS